MRPKTSMALVAVLWTLLLITQAWAGAGEVRGRLLDGAGEAVADGVVLFFNSDNGPPPSPGLYWRLPEIGGRLGPDGVFVLTLPEATYYFGVITPPDGSRMGPPMPEDWLYLHLDSRKKPALIKVGSGGKEDLGDIAATGLPALPDSQSMPVVRVYGTITRPDSTPAVNAVVDLFPVSGSAGMPLFSSERTDADGTYSLQVPAGDYLVRFSSWQPGWDGKGKGPARSRGANQAAHELQISIKADASERQLDYVLPESRPGPGKAVNGKQR